MALAFAPEKVPGQCQAAQVLLQHAEKVRGSLKAELLLPTFHWLDLFLVKKIIIPAEMCFPSWSIYKSSFAYRAPDTQTVLNSYQGLWLGGLLLISWSSLTKLMRLINKLHI